jgi:hypothetical protein
VGFMCFKGLMLHADDIETLCTDYPSTTVLIDHFGFCKNSKGDDWARLLALARFPQVRKKLEEILSLGTLHASPSPLALTPRGCTGHRCT